MNCIWHHISNIAIMKWGGLNSWSSSGRYSGIWGWGQDLKKLLEFCKHLANALRVTLQSSPVSVCALASRKLFTGGHYAPAEHGFLLKQILPGSQSSWYSFISHQAALPPTLLWDLQISFTYRHSLNRYSDRLTNTSRKSLILTCVAVLMRIILSPTYHLLFIKVAIIK